MKRGVRICLSFDRRRRQKLKKNDRPRPRMSGKREKKAFRDLGNAKNAEKCVSNPSESQKMQKNARRRLTKCEKR